MRVEFHWRPGRPKTLPMVVALVVTGLMVRTARAETAPKTLSSATTLVVFAEHGIPEGEWTDLSAAMRVGAAEAAKETPALRGGVEMVHGETIPAGLRLGSSIAVYLHGDCTLLPRPRYVQAGRLGWVKKYHGHIEPFIHVDCTQLVDMLGPMALPMTPTRRNMVMAEAMTRVILHEWIHIATQNAGHAEQGVAQAQFGVRDLLADDDVLGEYGGRQGKKGKSRSGVATNTGSHL